MTKCYTKDGKEKGAVNLPSVFTTSYRPDVIQRAVVALQSQRRQIYGLSPAAGLRTSADYFGNRHHSYRLTINRSQSRLPREKPGGGGLGKVRRVPQSVGGRRAHGPQQKQYAKQINNKELKMALESAIAATANMQIIQERGHNLEGVKEVPVVVEDALQSIKKTSEARQALKALGLSEDLTRGQRKKIQSGKAKLRGRRTRNPKSALIVVGVDEGIIKAAKNIQGVDVLTVESLDVESLAPGASAGRLTVWTESALKQLGK